MDSVIQINNLNKAYQNGQVALRNISLEIEDSEIFALLGPNGAGKSTLINIICGIVNSSNGTVQVCGYDINRDYRQARSQIGLVPQELSTDMFEKVWNTVNYSRGLFGKPANPEYIEHLLKQLSLWEKKDSMIMALSGGMKRRVMIAKALSHEPRILFLDEPTAGVDVELRKDMWEMVRGLRDNGVTIILTTHYIEEAELMADRIGVINKGKIIIVEDKNTLMKRLGQKQLTLHLNHTMSQLPAALINQPVHLSEDGAQLIYSYDGHQENTGIANILKILAENNVEFKDLHSEESSLEEIFVDLVRDKT